MSVAHVSNTSSSNSNRSSNEQQGNLQAAVARTLSRSLALYFSRPVRLFRPSKVSGWHSLRGLAASHGTSLSPQYIYGLIKTQGFIVIPKHFIPPMLINAMLGTILWSTYTESFLAMEPALRKHPILNAGLSGGVAGGVQALLAAPAENVRIVLEGGSGSTSWSNAWKEVFQGTQSRSVSRQGDIEDIRQLRGWMKEVGDMAGRGWNGWGWGMGKDICGFAAFFSIFEITRRIALQVKDISQNYFKHSGDESGREKIVGHQLPRVLHGVTLVSGGVIAGLAYEAISVPWDVARRAVQLDRITHSPHNQNTVTRVIVRKAQEDGILSFFSSLDGHREVAEAHSRMRARAYNVFRTLGRVGPWGIGFLTDHLRNTVTFNLRSTEDITLHLESMPTCTRKGCGQAFEAESTGICIHHPGAPVFHEGLKSWSCCNDVNKPVMEFDEFMKIPGCTQADRHTAEAPKVEAPKSAPTTSFSVSDLPSGKEVYSTSATTAVPSAPDPSPPPPRPVVEEEDDLSVPVAPGTVCRRNGCKTAFVSDAVNRLGDGEGTVCTYHPAPPIFREGSKGYLCCKRRVLEFDEFLKIGGCKTGRHLFSPPKTAPAPEQAEQMTTCRVDHYQTIDQVHVSIFAKKADKERSTIQFEGTQVKLDIYLPGPQGPQRFLRTLHLFGPIDPERSSFQFFGTKVELHLQKQDRRSWTLLEKTTHDIGNISLTFGVGGRTGTIGAKDVVLDDSNKARASQ
ncbi:putative CHORD [Lyophyllum shimeji]|uniref:CHORD n=1 Tax=Lyophyllum shimeji TaxID=47721 RepID=A0A9P3PFJ5_LYOSH|nr:putative CHORD [Lyophyllum shimeji]